MITQNPSMQKTACVKGGHFFVGAFISVIEWSRISAWLLMWGDELTLSQSDLYAIFPFGKEKVLKFLNSGELPAVKVGKDYITTFNLLEKWTEEHVGEEIYY